MAEEKWFVKRADIYQIDPRMIVIQPGFNPRTDFALDELRESIRENGVLVPIRIRRTKDGHNLLTDGERRYRAVMSLIDEGVPIVSIPCLLEKATSDAEVLVNAMLANTGKPFLPLEEAEAFRRFLAWGWSVEQLAKRLGKSQGFVRDRLTLLDAAPAVAAALQDGTATVSEVTAVVRESRKTDIDQGALLEARQDAKQARKNEPRERRKDTHQTIESQVAMLCRLTSPTQVLEALIAHVRTMEHDAEWVEALVSAQEWMAQKKVMEVS